MREKGSCREEVNCLPNFTFAPNKPCVVLPLADLHLPVFVANLHLPHLCHVCQSPDDSSELHSCHYDDCKALLMEGSAVSSHKFIKYSNFYPDCVGKHFSLIENVQLLTISAYQRLV